MANSNLFADFDVNGSRPAAQRATAIAAAIQAMANVATVIAANTTDVEGLPATPGLRLMGYSVGETAGATAVVTIRHGDANGDPAVGHVSLAANGVIVVTLPPGGVACPDGIWIDRESGTTEIVLYTKTIVTA